MASDLTALQDERYVINFCVECPEYLPQLHAELQSDDFDDPAARSAYDATRRLVERGIEVSPLTLRSELGNDLQSWNAIIAASTAGMVSSELAPMMALIAEQSRKRHTVKTLRRAMEAALDGEGQDHILAVLSAIGQRSRAEHTSLLDALDAFTRQHLDTERRGWIRETWLTKLNDIIREGFGPGEMILIAARPAMGKTAFAMQLVEHIARRYGRVGVVSLEMSKEQLAGRIVTQRLQVNTLALQAHHLDAAKRDLAELLVDFWDSPMPLSRLCNVLMAHKAKHPETAAYIIDYGGLIEPDAVDQRRNRTEQLEILTRRLKMLARRLGVPLFVLQQLNREAAANNRPSLRDLRGSGSWEQDADTVIFLHRPGYYDGAAPQDIAEIIVAKNRDGWDGVEQVRFERSTASFLNDGQEWAPPVAPSDYYDAEEIPF